MAQAEIYLMPTTTKYDLSPYSKFREYGPDYNRSIAVSCADIEDAEAKGNQSAADYFHNELLLRVGAITLDTFHERNRSL